VASEAKIPYLLVVGPRDAEKRNVSVRSFGIEHDLGAISLDGFIESVAREIETRGRDTVLADHFASQREAVEAAR
jgi:threonyl-tRNA synthetase